MLDYETPDPSIAPYRRGLFWSALALAVSVFPLIWMGGLVTSHKVGMSVPDWPNSYGYNMVLFPPSQWVGGIFYEHTHRLLGTLSGFLSLALMLMAWAPARTPAAQKKWTIAALALWALTVVAGVLAFLAARQSLFSEKIVHLLPHVAVGFGSLALPATLAMFCRTRETRRWVRLLTVGVFAAVCFQGLLGGLRVVMTETDLAMVHGCFAQVFFSAAAFTVLATSKWWRSAAESKTVPAGRVWLAGATVAVIVGQLVVGAIMRHNEAGLAIPGVLVYGQVLPPTDAAGLEKANIERIWNANPLPATTLPGIWVHFTHRVGAVIVSGFVIAIAWAVLRQTGPKGAAGRAAVILLGLLLTQVTLGVLTVYLRKPADIASLHVAVGALTLMTASVLTAMLARQAEWRTVRREQPAPAGQRLATV